EADLGEVALDGTVLREADDQVAREPPANGRIEAGRVHPFDRLAHPTQHFGCAFEVAPEYRGARGDRDGPSVFRLVVPVWESMGFDGAGAESLADLGSGDLRRRLVLVERGAGGLGNLVLVAGDDVVPQALERCRIREETGARCEEAGGILNAVLGASD